MTLDELQHGEYTFLDLEAWLQIHYPQILIEYSNVQENILIQEDGQK